MARITSIATSALTRHLNGDQGVPDKVGQLIMAGDISLSPLSAADILERHVTAEIAEKTSGVRYPVVYVYCEKVKNDLREKFRTFSGTVDLSVDIRVSHEHMDDLQGSLQKYVEAVTDVLHKKRGQWTTAVFYTGGYEIQYGPIKRGGKNFVQSAKVELTVNVSVE
jgi:hypothetical protein